MDDKTGNIIIIDENNAGQRFDKFLIRQFPVGGKGFVYKMLRKKRVKLNNARAEGSEMLMAGDRVTLYISPETREALSAANEGKKVKSEKSKTALRVLYEDEEVLVVDKPVNCLTHPDLTDEALNYVGVVSGNGIRAFEPVAVNRLDRNTTGIVILAKTLPAAQELSRVIRERGLLKLYLAAVAGVVDKPLILKGTHVKDRAGNKAGFNQDFASKTGKEAVTEIEPMFCNGEITILKINLVTGRSHQIRAHLQSIGKPVIGDPKYGSIVVNRKYKEKYGADFQLLHAWKVRFDGLGGRLGYLNGKEVNCEPEGALGRVLSDFDTKIQKK